MPKKINMKNLYYILLFTLLLSLSAKAQDKHKTPKQDKNYPYIWHVTKNNKFTMYGTVYNTAITFKSREAVLADLEDKRKLNMWTDEQYKKELEVYSYLKGGIVFLDITRPTIGAANTEFFTIIIRDSADNEITRKQLDSKVADYSKRGSVTDWNNSGFIVIREPLPKEFKVYVIDAVLQERYEFIVKGY